MIVMGFNMLCVPFKSNEFALFHTNNVRIDPFNSIVNLENFPSDAMMKDMRKSTRITNSDFSRMLFFNVCLLEIIASWWLIFVFDICSRGLNFERQFIQGEWIKSIHFFSPSNCFKLFGTEIEINYRFHLCSSNISASWAKRRAESYQLA